MKRRHCVRNILKSKDMAYGACVCVCPLFSLFSPQVHLKSPHVSPAVSLVCEMFSCSLFFLYSSVFFPFNVLFKHPVILSPHVTSRHMKWSSDADYHFFISVRWFKHRVPHTVYETTNTHCSSSRGLAGSSLMLIQEQRKHILEMHSSATYTAGVLRHRLQNTCLTVSHVCSKALPVVFGKAS